jgi:hypothetical protein
VARSTDQQAQCRCATHDQNNKIIWASTLMRRTTSTRPINAMTKSLDELAQTSLLECAVDTSARKKLIDAMPLNTDPPINRAMVVRCAISATRNYLKLHMPKRLNPLLSNIHAGTRKLWKRSAVPVPAFRPAAGLPCIQACTSSRAAVTPTIQNGRNT